MSIKNLCKLNLNSKVSLEKFEMQKNVCKTNFETKTSGSTLNLVGFGVSGGGYFGHSILCMSAKETDTD
jgi:hypothetical protein